MPANAPRKRVCGAAAGEEVVRGSTEPATQARVEVVTRNRSCRQVAAASAAVARGWRGEPR